MPLSARLYLAVDALVRRSLRAVEAVHRGLWLGLLDPRTLDIATQHMYMRSASCGQAEYNRSGFRYWEAGMVARHFQGVRRVLVAAAGGGREMLALGRMGIHADGFDPDPEFVACGRQLLADEGLPGELNVCAPGQVPAGVAGYDAAILGWNAYTHIPGRRARVDFLRAMAAGLDPGARILISFFARAERDRAFALTSWVGRVSGALRLRREPVELGDTLMVGFYHYFSETELAHELQAAGMQLLEFSDHPQGHAVAALRGA